MFPAAAARGLGLGDVPLICAQEIDVAGALTRVVRVMAHIETERSRSERGPRLSARRRGAAPGPRAVTGGPSSVLVVGSGLIGASIGLGLRRRGSAYG